MSKLNLLPNSFPCTAGKSVVHTIFSQAMFRYKFRIFLAILFFNLIKSSIILNESEKNITRHLMKDLEISHWILVTDSNKLNMMDFIIIKDFLKWGKPFTIFSPESLNKSISKENIPNVNTLFVLKVSNITTVATYFNTVLKVSEM